MREFNKQEMVLNYETLSDWLSTLTYEDFHDNIKIKKGHSERDIYQYKKYHRSFLSTVTLDMVISYGDKYLVDIGGYIAVLTLTKRKYKLPGGRVVKSKFDRSLIVNKHSVNGYWIIPDRFYM